MLAASCLGMNVPRPDYVKYDRDLINILEATSNLEVQDNWDSLTFHLHGDEVARLEAIMLGTDRIYIELVNVNKRYRGCGFLPWVLAMILMYKNAVEGANIRAVELTACCIDRGAPAPHAYYASQLGFKAIENWGNDPGDAAEEITQWLRRLRPKFNGNKFELKPVPDAVERWIGSGRPSMTSSEWEVCTNKSLAPKFKISDIQKTILKMWHNDAPVFQRALKVGSAYYRLVKGEEPKYHHMRKYSARFKDLRMEMELPIREPFLTKLMKVLNFQPSSANAATEFTSMCPKDKAQFEEFLREFGAGGRLSKLVFKPKSALELLMKA